MPAGTSTRWAWCSSRHSPASCPFSGENPVAVATKHVYEAAARPTQDGAEYSEDHRGCVPARHGEAAPGPVRRRSCVRRGVGGARRRDPGSLAMIDAKRAGCPRCADLDEAVFRGSRRPIVVLAGVAGLAGGSRVSSTAAAAPGVRQARPRHWFESKPSTRSEPEGNTTTRPATRSIVRGHDLDHRAVQAGGPGRQGRRGAARPSETPTRLKRVRVTSSTAGGTFESLAEGAVVASRPLLVATFRWDDAGRRPDHKLCRGGGVRRLDHLAPQSRHQEEPLPGGDRGG